MPSFLISVSDWIVQNRAKFQKKRIIECIFNYKNVAKSIKKSPKIMKIPSIFFQMEVSKNWENQLEILAPGTLCPKISFLAQKLRAVAREQTDRQRKQNLETPFFCNLFFYDWVENENQKHMQK